MRNIRVTFILVIFLLISCGEKSIKKRNLDDTLFKYAALIRWSSYNDAMGFLMPDFEEIQPSSFELQKLKQFKVSRYLASPISPGSKDSEIHQTVEIQLYNIHTNKLKTIQDSQTWEYRDDLQQWFLTSGLPKIL